MPAALAEAFVRLRPDLTTFRQELQTQVTAAVTGVRVPPLRVPVIAASVGDVAPTAALTAADEALALASDQAAAATGKLDAALRTEDAALISNAEAAAANATSKQAAAAADRELAASQAVTAKRLGGVESGLIAQTAALTGLRGAALATSGPFIAGAAGAIALAGSLKTFASFEQTLDVFQATTRATADQMERVSEAARQLGKDVSLPAVSASDAAEAMSGLARAGLSVNESIAGARGVLQLATAANIDFSQSVDIVAGALNAFQLEGEDAVHVADLLANASILAQGEIGDFGAAFQQVEAVAHQFGVTIEDTTALLTLLAQAGLRGSDAGTSLRTAILRLGAPTQQANTLIKSLGLQVRDLQGNIRPEVFAEFVRATESLGDATQDALASEIFGQDAIRAAITAGQAGTQALDQIREAEDRAGAAAELAAARTKGLAGQVEALKSQAETTAATLGESLAPAAESAVTAFRLLGGAIDELLAKQQDLAGDQSVEESVDNTKSNMQILREALFTPLGPINATKDALHNLITEFQRPVQPPITAAAHEFAASLNPVFTALNQLKTNAPSLSAGFDPLATQAQILAENLRGLQALGPNASDALKQPFLDAIDGAMAVLATLGPRAQSVIDAQGPAFVAAFDPLLREAVEKFTGLGDLVAPTIPPEVQKIIDQFALTPAGRQALKDVGADINKSLAAGIEEDTSGIKAARKAVTDAIEAGQQQVIDSIRSARGNLESLGSSLGDQIRQIFEAAPTEASKALDKLRASLEALQEASERRRLRFDLGQARRELADAQESLQNLGAATPQQQAARAEFLAPFIEKVKDAEAASKEFSLEQQIQDQEDLRDAAAKASEEGLAKIVGDFEAGKTNATEFAASLNQLVKPALAELPKANLGFNFTRDFRRNMTTLLQQAQELAGFLGTAGTTPGPQAISVRDAQRAAQERVDAARQNLTDQLNKSRQATNDNTAAVKALTTAINTATKPRPGQSQRNSRDPGRANPDVLVPTNK